MLPRAILFDLGDTLVRLQPFPQDMAMRLGTRLRDICGVDPERAGTLAGGIATAVATAISEASHAAQRDEVRISDIVARELRAAGLDRDEAECLLLADAWGDADLERIHNVQGRPALLQSLRDRGLRLGIVSNTTTRGPLLTAMLDRFGLLPFFDAIVYSGEAGVRKPHPAIYEAALDALAVQPSEVIFVGDRLREDVLGPSALGMRALLTHEFYQSPHEGEPFAVLQRLEEISTVLDQISANIPSGAPHR